MYGGVRVSTSVDVFDLYLEDESVDRLAACGMRYAVGL